MILQDSNLEVAFVKETMNCCPDVERNKKKKDENSSFTIDDLRNKKQNESQLGWLNFFVFFLMSYPFLNNEFKL